MTFADLCMFLGVLIAFATLVVRMIEAAGSSARAGLGWQPGSKRM